MELFIYLLLLFFLFFFFLQVPSIFDRFTFKFVVLNGNVLLFVSFVGVLHRAVLHSHLHICMNF